MTKRMPIHMYKINDYDVFVFDFDGTIMDTERYHYLSWKKTIQEFIPDFNISEDDYFKYSHNLDKSTFKNYLSDTYGLNNYDILYQKKGSHYNEFVKMRIHMFIGNIEMFLQKICTHKNKKELVMVTNSSISSIQLFVDLIPQLSVFNKIYTRENFTNRKPNPECYQKIVELYPNKRIVGFEDSNVGVHALCQVPQITPFHIKPAKYYYNDRIQKKYTITSIENYDCFE